MSVILADIPADGDVSAIDVSASNYDADRLHIEQDGDAIVLTRKQIQQLSLAIERFMDR